MDAAPDNAPEVSQEPVSPKQPGKATKVGALHSIRRRLAIDLDM